MRILFCLTACLLLCVNLPAQLPQLTAADPASPIYLSNLSIDVRVIGNRATTTFTMAFHNPSERVLEGQFTFPLPEGANVSRYALDVAGKMREGVPVEKVRATEVFEAIEKRQVDPGLLEKTEGANFRTRIYPVPAGGERRVILGFEQELLLTKSGELVYQLPLEAKEVLRTLSINVTVLQQEPSPLVDAVPVGSLAFTRSPEGYTARAMGENVRLQGSLAFRIPKNSSRPEVFVQKGDGRHTFYVHIALSGPAKEKVLPKRVAVIWDNSLSGLYRDTASELQLLKNYLTECRNTTVLLYSLHHRFRAEGEYAIREGNTTALLQKIRSLPYDGGTDYSKVRLPKVEEVLFFSDGVSTLSDSPFQASPCPVYAVSGSSRANHGTLRSIAQSSGGIFINLKNTTPEEAVESLRSQSFYFLGVKGGKKSLSFYPTHPSPVAAGFTLAGEYDGREQSIRLQFGYGRTVTTETVVRLPGSENRLSSQWDLRRLVAQKRVQELESDEEKNKAEILRLGREHSLVTSFTSLLVLESLDDYVEHEIQPPVELLKEYNRRLQEKRSEITERRKETIENALAYSNKLRRWWNTRFLGLAKPVEKLTIAQTVTNRDSATIHPRTLALRAPVIKRDEEVRLDANAIANTNALPLPLRQAESVHKALTGSVAGVQVSEVVVTAYSRSVVRVRGQAATQPGVGEQLLVVDGKLATAMPDKDQITNVEALSERAGIALYGAKAINGVLLITTKAAGEAADEVGEGTKGPQIQLMEKASGAAYMQSMAAVPSHQQYATYLKLREQHLFDPTFYYEMATFFAKADKALALQVVTNLGELDFQNHELYRLLGYKLRELGEGELAAYVFKQVLQWRPQEPQSYRDYALALLDNKKFQQALDTLYRALSHPYTSEVMEDMDGIEETIVTELSHLVHQHPDKVNTAGIPKGLLRKLPVDVRVVLNWNMDDVDIDLWVTDPGGEVCDYKNNETKIGGRLSDDFTNGYGPEQFLLKKGVTGTYKVQVHYYGERGVKLAGKTTLLVEIYTNYGRKNEERKLITLQLDDDEKEGIYVGEFTF
ncbi:DUF2135 domain-containing protein [Flavisolibacter sp. BT320]|nr:DUF2135 domain-containing protein [Flavisolibacter longurius]